MVWHSYSNKLNFEVVKYESNDLRHTDELDWLVIQIRASDVQYEWSATDPAIACGELADLTNWLKELQNTGNVLKEKLKFTEPEISFGFDTRSSVIKVCFNYTLHPKWERDYKVESDSEYCLSFKLSDINLDESIKYLEKSQANYPGRGIGR